MFSQTISQLKGLRGWLIQLTWPGHLRPLNRRLVVISDQCDLACYPCKLESTPISEKVLSRQIALRSPSKFLPLQIDVVGGDPLLFPDRIEYVFQNRPFGSKINLWTPGIGDWAPILPLLSRFDHIFLFAPKLNGEAYLEYSGRDRFNKFQDSVQLLKENNIPVTVVQRIAEIDINELPYGHEWILEQGVDWLFFNKRGSVTSKDGAAYRDRYSGMNRCYLRADVKTRRGLCLGYPY